MQLDLASNGSSNPQPAMASTVHSQQWPRQPTASLASCQSSRQLRQMLPNRLSRGSCGHQSACWHAAFANPGHALLKPPHLLLPPEDDESSLLPEPEDEESSSLLESDSELLASAAAAAAACACLSAAMRGISFWR